MNLSQYAVWVFYFFVVGACVGSFINVVIYRLPNGESVIRPRSRCPGCKERIKPWHNIPILSYFLLLGKCAQCGNKISGRYPMVEMMTALLFSACYARFGLTPAAVAYMGFSGALVAVAFIDIDHFIIPDVITLPGIVIGFACSYFLLPISIGNAFWGFLAGGGLFFLLAMAVPGGMGGGDIKLMGMIGAFLGLKPALITIFAGSLIGAVGGIIGMIAFGKGRKSKIPFGPYLVMGALAALFFERELIELYMNAFVR
ncbi:MAG: type 4 prepilin-like proteins leader peptide-processing enzyme [bacterium]|nr:MAG: type 4 prepilin-like proteins leader peptide-processing enzyme [bacterium]